MTLSERLRAAREARNWTVEEVGAQLRLPARVIVRVESGLYEDLGAPIYRRGYLRSFARLVGVPDADVEAELVRLQGEVPALVATGVMARSEYVTERYLRPATYIALTALIALPVVWWAASGRLGQELSSNARSLDLQPQVMLPMTGDGVERSADAVEGQNSEVVRASLMPLPKDSVRDLVVPEPRLPVDVMEHVEATVDPVEEADPSSGNIVGRGRREAVLVLSSASWVEVVTADGRRLQQALLQPGRWQYRSDGPLSFTIGNSSDAQLHVIGGETVDLGAYRSSNDVARVRVFAGNG